jgi:hypothetical protein
VCRSPERAFLIRNGWLGFCWRAAVFCRWTRHDGRSARCLLAPVPQRGLDAACRRSWRPDCLSFGRKVAKSLVVATISCSDLASSCHLSAAGVRHPLDLRSASLIRFSADGGWVGSHIFDRCVTRQIGDPTPAPGARTTAACEVEESLARSHAVTAPTMILGADFGELPSGLTSASSVESRGRRPQPPGLSRDGLQNGPARCQRRRPKLS